MTLAIQRRSGAATGLPLLASKLVAPSMPGRVVERPRLFELLGAGVERPVTLVAAPAGSGKTMLLTSWMSAASPPGPVAWLSLDRGDNDPARFWAYLLAALCRSGALPAGSALQSLVSSPQGNEALAPMLLHGLEELASPVVLVLDDLHELTEPRVLEGIELLLRHAPPRLRLVLSSRADPPLPLHRLLVSGRLTQLRGADLAFTVAEVAELLAEYDYRPRLSEDDLAVLQARTEGWAAGLRLAAVSMQHQPDPHRYVMELAGDDRSLAGYLVAEVLEQQPAELRGFLLRTCVVDKLTGELADTLTGRDDGERTLARLERANAFVVALDSRHEWYRYHPLFAELLRYELRREAPREVPELRRRAARWYAGRGLAADAIQQAGMVGDWGYAAELAAEHGLGLVLDGEPRRFRDVLDRLPAEAVRLDPELGLLKAAERIAADDGADAALRLARERERLLADDRRPRFDLVVAICRLLRARRAGDLGEALAAGREALAAHERLGDDTDLGGVAGAARAVALSGLGTAELWSGELDAAAEHLHAGHAAALGAGLDDVRLDCLSTLALVQAIGGQLSLAVRTGEAVVELAGQHAGAPTPVAGALLALAWASYQRDDLAAAAGYLERAVEGAAAAQDRSLRVAVKLLAGRLRHVQADPAGAFAELQLATDDVDPAGVVSTLSPFLDELALASLDPAPAVVPEMPVLIEALSERERTVLRYLPTMLTFGEIGSELYISVNTTRSHVRNIYRKLGAVGRRDAVRRARQLQLLRS